MAYHDQRISYYRASRKTLLGVYRLFCYFVCFYIFKTPVLSSVGFHFFFFSLASASCKTSAATNPACAGRSPLSTHLCRCLVLVPSSLGTRIRHSFPQQHHAHTSTDVIPSPCVDPLSCIPVAATSRCKRLSSQSAPSTPYPSPLSTQSTYFSAFIPIRKT
jgi:hypothetical protein